MFKQLPILTLYSLFSLISMDLIAIPLNPAIQFDGIYVGSSTDTPIFNYTILASGETILEFETFDLSSNEQLTILLPDETSKAFIHVTAPSPTFLAGKIISNGSLYFMNKQGIFIENTAEIFAPEIFFWGNSITNLGLLRAQTADLRGGTITLSGSFIVLQKHSVLNSSGSYDGGKIFVGGGWHGKDSAIPNAISTYIEYGAVLFADSLVNGDGGTVIVWSEKKTTFKGNISATGRGNGPGGGYAQVSSKGHLIFDGQVVLCSDNGSEGKLDK